MQDEAASKPDVDHFLSPNKPIAPKPVSKIQPIPEDWHVDIITQVALKKFDPSMLADDDKLKNVSDQLSIVLEHKNIAVVTEGLVESKAPKFGIKFVELYMLGKESLCLVCFESSVEDGQVVTVEKTGRMSLSGHDYLGYLKQRRELLEYEGNIEKAINNTDEVAYFKLSSKGEPSSEEVPTIHVGKTALYMTDYELGKNASLLELRGPMKYILPSREWCLTEPVSVIACFCEYFCSAMLTLFPRSWRTARSPPLVHMYLLHQPPPSRRFMKICLAQSTQCTIATAAATRLSCFLD